MSEENTEITGNSESTVKRFVRRVRIGMKVMVKDGAIIGQDCKFGPWKDEGEILIVESKLANNKNRYVLKGDGYGNKENYGDGVLFVNKYDLVHV